MRTIIWQPSVQTVKQTDQVEQRGDVRIALTIVIAEQTFVVTNQAGKHIRRNQLPVVREALRRREFERTIVTARRSETANRGIATGQVFSSCLITCATTSRIEDEVRAAIIERTILDHVLLRAINTAEADREVALEVVFDAGRVLVNSLRLQARIDRSAIAAEIAEVSSTSRRHGVVVLAHRARRGVETGGVKVEVNLL